MYRKHDDELLLNTKVLLIIPYKGSSIFDHSKASLKAYRSINATQMIYTFLILSFLWIKCLINCIVHFKSQKMMKKS